MALMDAVRTMSGTSGKLNISDATEITSSAGEWGVRVPNLIKDSTAEYQTTPKKDSYQYASGAVTAGTKYTTSIAIKNTPIEVALVPNSDYQKRL